MITGREVYFVLGSSMNFLEVSIFRYFTGFGRKGKENALNFDNF